MQLCELELSCMEQERGLDIEVHHFSQSTSKWNKIERQLFLVHHNELARTPFDSQEVIVSVIASTKTRSGLGIHAELDGVQYLKGQVVCDEDFAATKLERSEFHGV